jgi:hypothetical protein
MAPTITEAAASWTHPEDAITVERGAVVIEVWRGPDPKHTPALEAEQLKALEQRRYEIDAELPEMVDRIPWLKNALRPIPEGWTPNIDPPLAGTD